MADETPKATGDKKASRKSNSKQKPLGYTIGKTKSNKEIEAQTGIPVPKKSKE